MTLQHVALSWLERQCSELGLGRDRFRAQTSSKPRSRTGRRNRGPIFHTYTSTRTQLAIPSFMWAEPAIGMALISARAILRGRGRDVWEMLPLDEASSSAMRQHGPVYQITARHKKSCST
jgi:hypothetical protein